MSTKTTKWQMTSDRYGQESTTSKTDCPCGRPARMFSALPDDPRCPECRQLDEEQQAWVREQERRAMRDVAWCNRSWEQMCPADPDYD
jgi:hypothetical protein